MQEVKEGVKDTVDLINRASATKAEWHVLLVCTKPEASELKARLTSQVAELAASVKGQWQDWMNADLVALIEKNIGDDCGTKRKLSDAGDKKDSKGR